MQAPCEGHAPSGAGRNVGLNQKLVAATVVASEGMTRPPLLG